MPLLSFRQHSNLLLPVCLGAWLVGPGPLTVSAAAAEPNTAPASSPRQGAALLKSDILTVFAHPDDETGMASTLAHYALGRTSVVANVYITRGEGGGNMVGTQAGPALGLLREAELRDCLARLGVRHCYFLDQLDWAYTESLGATLDKWGHEETLRRLVRVVRALRPEVILTMNPAPNPGQHGHHQAAGILATEAFDAAADPQRFPEQLRQEGLEAWQPRKLYYSGGGSNATARIEVSAALPNGSTPAEVAADALSQHRSQAFGNFRNSPWLARPQSFTLLKSVVPVQIPETDLLAGLSSVPPTPHRVTISGPSADSRTLLRFVPRPAIANYQRWVKEQGIEHVTVQFRADLPVVAGAENTIALEILGDGVPAVAASSLRVQAPEGWIVSPAERPVRPNAGQTTVVHFTVTPPAGRPAAGELTATLTRGDQRAPLTASALAHPVPLLKVPRVQRAPALRGADEAWAGLPATRITSTNLVQGRATNEADSSALFRLAHDRRTLFVEIEVADDRVVSNIASNDIKGHWRSDSVELCVDPAGGAEHTMDAFKLGIFPFDATGVVRAARDADARQGPVEETAPGTRLVSERTPTGYRIRAAIPFSEIGLKARRGHRFGFNVIVYDGDKPDAAPGENINESRIAWAPRAGVQGRPEDWGRIELE